MSDETEAMLRRLEKLEERITGDIEEERSKLKRNILSGLVFLGTGAALSHTIPLAYNGIQSETAINGDYVVLFGSVITTVVSGGLGLYNLARAYIRADNNFI